MNFDSERLRALILTAAIEFAAYLLLPFTPRNEMYFAAGGAFISVNVVFVLAFLSLNKLSFDLVTLSGIQLIIQLIGLVDYELRITPKIYVWSAHAIVTFTFLRILFAGRYDRNTARCCGWSISNFLAIMGRRQTKEMSL